VVLKPSVLGSLERVCAVVRWCAVHGVKCVVSSAFEGPVGIASLGSLAAAANALAGQQAYKLCSVTTPAAESAAPPGLPPRAHACDMDTAVARSASASATSHGLGTLDWFGEATSGEAPSLLPIASQGATGVAQMRLSDMHAVHAHLCALHDAAPAPPLAAVAKVTRQVHVRTDEVSAEMRVPLICLPAAQGERERGVVLFLHGFLGQAEDWLPVMAGLAHSGYRCVAMDLPGHGAVDRRSCSSWHEEALNSPRSLPFLSALALEVLRTVARDRPADTDACESCIVGYSLGARIALEAAAQAGPEVGLDRVVVVSGSPGIDDEAAAAARRRQDAETGRMLTAWAGGEGGLAEFAAWWYSQPLWGPLRQHPRFAALMRKRAAAGHAGALAQVLTQCSSGQQNRWPEVLQGRLRCPTALVVGAWDSKFVGIARRMAGVEAVQAGAGAGEAVSQWLDAGRYPVAEVAHAGHAVHEEQPVALVAALLHLLSRSKP
jgi:2-succinyl-6-hydroxy-2,4-cyclohexadiene-1-carboxylate synthase